MNYFKINSDYEIYLYGAASIGKILYENLTSYNITPKAFIDKRADEIKSFMGIPVINISDVPVKEKTVVIVSVKNVFEHNSIVSEFIDSGIYNLVYIPKTVLEGVKDPDLNVIASIYNNMLEGLVDTDRCIPISLDYSKPSIHETGVIEKKDNRLIVLLPATFLYTNNYDEDKHIWGNINVLAFFTHLSFFRYLAGDETCNYEDYLEDYCVYTALIQGDIKITQKWKDNVVRNRAMIYRNMKQAFYFDRNFFLRNPAEALYNYEKNYFNLTSGKHRTMFLISKGYAYVPVSVSRNDYSYYVNKNMVDELFNFVIKNKIKTIDNISNPYFYDFPDNDSGLEFAIISKLSMFFAKELYLRYGRVDFSKLSVFFQEDIMSSVQRHFSRMGAYVYLMSKKNELNGLIEKIERVSIGEFNGNLSDCNDICVFVGDYTNDMANKCGYIATFNIIDGSNFEEIIRTESIIGDEVRRFFLYRRL